MDGLDFGGIVLVAVRIGRRVLLLSVALGLWA
jgi:hypothetical protein